MTQPEREPQREPEGAPVPTIRIGLLWHSLQSGNLGVRALTDANMALIEDVAREEGLKPAFVVMAMGERGATANAPNVVEQFLFTTRSLVSPSGYWQALSRVDTVVDIGAGDSFADIYGPKRFAFLWLSKAMTLARGVPLLLAPQTIGPFDKRAYRTLAATVMKRSVAVIARDQASLTAAQAIAPGAHAALAVDVAFRLPFEDRSSQRGGPRLRVGVNASGLLFHEAETGRNRFGLSYDYAAATRALLAALALREDVEVLLVPHATSVGDPSDDDGRLADRLAAEFPGVMRVPDFASASDAKSFISGLDFLVAARMHACIAAFSSGTPVVPVAYSRKFAGLFGMVDYPHVLPVNGLDGAQVLARVLAAIEDRATLAGDIATGMRRVEVLLDVYRAELRRLFALVRCQA